MSTPSARAIRKAQEIRHVRRAIRFYEHKKNEIALDRERRRHQTQYHQMIQNRKAETQSFEKTALKNARIDWELGHLRPNRGSYGPQRDLYGLTPITQAQIPEVPKHWVGSEDVRKRVTNIPDAVVRDFSPFQPDDRVLIMKGKDKGKIGVVVSAQPRRNTLQIQDINKVWIDASEFGAKVGGEIRREIDLPTSIDDVRLVVPQTINGIRRDVVVESLELERHFSGMNLFTGNEEKDIPEAHQVDPETGDPIWHRYIAGTRTRIDWPWEETAQKKQDARENEAVDGILHKSAEKPTEGVSKEPLTISERIARTVGWGKNRKSADTKPESSETSIADDNGPEKVLLTKPPNREPRVQIGDTTRNFIEDETYKSWMPSLRYEPFPSSVLEEVAGPEWKRNKLDSKAEDFDEQLAEIRAQKAQIKAEKKRAVQAHIDTMKTPLEVKWELAQAAKAKEYDPKAPPQVSEFLLSAIGQYIASKQLRK